YRACCPCRCGTDPRAWAGERRSKGARAMIIPMAKVRVLGPRGQLDDTLRVLQDFGLLHLTDASGHGGLVAPSSDPRDARHRRQLAHAIEDIDQTLAILGARPLPLAAEPANARMLPRWVALARRTRRHAQQN